MEMGFLTCCQSRRFAAAVKGCELQGWELRARAKAVSERNVVVCDFRGLHQIIRLCRLPLVVGAGCAE